MAYCRMGHIKESKTGNAAQGLKNCIEYIYNPQKTQNGKYTGGYNLVVTPDTPAEDAYTAMIATKKSYMKEDGRQGYHYKLSFAGTDNVTPELALKITHEFCEKNFTDYECAYSVHDNTHYLHSHIVINSVSHFTGYKYHYKKGDWAKYIQPIANELCKKYNLSTIDLNLDEQIRLQHKCKTYNKSKCYCGYSTDDTNYFSRKKILKDVKSAITASTVYEDFIDNLSLMGYVVNDKRKHVTVLAPGRERPVRLYTLTKDKKTYTRDNIKKMIAGTFLYRKQVREFMSDTWDEYFTPEAKLTVSKVSKDMAIYFETETYKKKHNLFSDKEINQYFEYLSRADQQVNYIRNYILQSFSEREKPLNLLEVMEQSKVNYDNYEKSGLSVYKEGHERYNRAKEVLSQNGYEPEKLKLYKASGERILEEISKYKKHIFVEKKICTRIKKQLNNTTGTRSIKSPE